MADYVFIESVGDDASPVTRYEVRCRKCGECYGEESQPLMYPPVSVAVEPPIVWPRDHEPVPPRDWRQELRERVDRAGDVTTRVGKEAAGAAERWGGHAAGRLRNWAGAVKHTLETRSTRWKRRSRRVGAASRNRTRRKGTGQPPKSTSRSRPSAGTPRKNPQPQRLPVTIRPAGKPVADRLHEESRRTS